MVCGALERAPKTLVTRAANDLSFPDSQSDWAAAVTDINSEAWLTCMPSDARKTAYTVGAVDGPTITVTEGADVFRSPITQVLSERGRVDASLTSLAFHMQPAGWAATDDRRTKSWKVLDIAGGNDFTLDGPVAREDFAPEDVLRIWQYGVGDTVRQSTFLSVRRLDDGAYEVQGDVDCEITINGKTRRITVDDLANGAVRF